MMEPPAIAATGLSKHYGDGALRIDALRKVDLSLAVSEVAVITGPSGSGKSTLMAIISGLLRPDSGAVRALGVDLAGLTPAGRDRFRLANVGFIFQGFHLLPALSVLEQVTIVLDQMGVAKRQAHAQASAMLESVGLQDRRTRRPGELSGGEKQRVAIARALAKAPKLLFADEPTSALDAANGRIVGGLLRRSAKDVGAAVVCVTHDSRLLEFADRALTMEDGAIVSNARSTKVEGLTQD